MSIVKCTKALTKIAFFHGEPAQQNYRHFIKKIKHSGVRSLKVNETKLTLRNVFISGLFTLGGEKEAKYNERIPFSGSVQKP